MVENWDYPCSLSNNFPLQLSWRVFRRVYFILILGDFDLGDLGLGDFNLGDFNLGDFDLGDFDM